MPYRIAINKQATGKIPQGDPAWRTFNDDFENKLLDPLDIANAIYGGHAYTTWHEGRRCSDNFICGQHLAIDLDTGDERSSIEYLRTLTIVRTYASIIHTTPSHTEDSPRARVLFLLGGCITSAAGYKAAASFLASQFDGADTVCTDAARFFYGAFDCRIELVLSELPLLHLRHEFLKWQRTHSADRPQNTDRADAPPTREDICTVDNGGWDLGRLVAEMERATEGKRNHELNRLSFIAGKMVKEGTTTENEAQRALTEAAQLIGLGESEAVRTFRSGFHNGTAKGH